VHVVVIGAGVIGATTALALAERGIQVTVLERNGQSALETSCANGGGISPAHAEPWNAPGLPGRIIRDLGKPRASYRLSPLAIAGMGRWGLEFLRQMQPARFRNNARDNIRLALYSLDCLKAWRERYRIDYDQVTNGSLQLFFDARSLEQAWQFRVALLDGLAPVSRLSAEQAVEIEPALAPVQERLAGAVRFPDHESGDARRFSQAVLRHAEALGATVRFDVTATGLHFNRTEFRAVLTGHGAVAADACVLACGPDSAALARSAGLRLPIHAVRGYSATFELDQPDLAPILPMLDVASRFVTLRLGERGFRVAGLADFARPRRDIPRRRIDCLLAGARHLLPRLSDELTVERAELWAGLRPVTPNGKPLLGQSSVPGLWVNAGHGPMGWTMACGSSTALADHIAGRAWPFSLKPFRPA